MPVSIQRRSSLSVSGDVTKAAASTSNGYVVDEMESIVDKEGNEYMSSTKIFFKPDVQLDVTDTVAFPVGSKFREIRKLGGFFDGVSGTLDIVVVYL
jgi:hypothetical protein